MKKHLIIYVFCFLFFSIVLCGAASAATVNPGINAIKNAISTSHNGDTLNISVGTYKEHDLIVNKNLTIIGPQVTGNKTPTAVIDGQNLGKVFIINSGATVTLQNLIIKNGNISGEEEVDGEFFNRGGGIYNNGTLKIINCHITQNHAQACSGGILNTNGTVTLTTCNLYNNTAGLCGGALCTHGGLVIFTSCNVYDNTGAESGSGGISTHGGTVNIINSNIYNNMGVDGGGIDNENCKMIISGSNIYNNTSTVNGGGIQNSGGTINITGSSVNYNSASKGDGGGIYNLRIGQNTSNIYITNSNVNYNKAYICGGISNADGTVKISFSNVNNNLANHTGGISNGFEDLMTITNSNVNYNTATEGSSGGIDNNGNMTITNSNVNYNTATDEAGGINNWEPGIMMIKDSYVEHNTAYCGGGIFNDVYEGNLTIKGSSISYNTATDYGGGIENYGGNCTATDCIFSHNTVINPLFNNQFYGGAILNYEGIVNANYNWIYGNSNYQIHNYGSSLVNVENNWWVPNEDPTPKIYGNVNFTPWLIDTTPPTISKSDPANGATSVTNNKVIKITFNEPIKEGNMDIQLKNSNGVLIPITTTLNGKVLSITPNSSLAEGKYTLILSGGCVADLVGYSSTAYTLSFISGKPPIVNAIDPANNAVNIPTNKIIKITFNENIKAGNMIIVLKNSSGTPVTVTKSLSGKLLSITPTNPLAESIYTLIIQKGAVTDLAGNPSALHTSKFSTGTSPSIKTSDPANNALNVLRNKQIKITFSEPVLWGNFWIELKNGAGTVIPITKSITGSVLTITPSTLLAAGTKYSICLHTGCVKDYAGNPLTGCIRIFTTTNSTDITSPIITTVDPANNALNVLRNKQIKITFSEPVLWGNFWIELKNGAGTVIPITKSITGSVLTITPSTLLAAGTKYSICLHTGCVKDYAGNPLTGCIRSFTTNI